MHAWLAASIAVWLAGNTYAPANICKASYTLLLTVNTRVWLAANICINSNQHTYMASCKCMYMVSFREALTWHKETPRSETVELAKMLEPLRIKATSAALSRNNSGSGDHPYLECMGIEAMNDRT